MTLKEYVNAFPRLQRKAVHEWIASQLRISATYVRSMCNGVKRIPEKYALQIEKLTDGAVPRYITAPQMYPSDEYFSNNKSGVKQ